MLPMPFEVWTTYPKHSGVDFPYKTGTPILASGDGVVTRISWSLTGGWRVWVKYGKAGSLKYCHMNTREDILCEVGNTVRYGTAIALVGELGKNSTGPHLHLENGAQAGFDSVWKILDPTSWVNKAAAPINPEPKTQTSKDDEMAMRVIECPAYTAAGQRALTDGETFQTVPAGWVQNLITHGRVSYVNYPDNGMFTQEIDMFYFMKGKSRLERENELSRIVGDIFEKHATA